MLGPPSHPTPRRVFLAACGPGGCVRSGDGPARRFTSHTRRIVITTARATPANAPRTVCKPLMDCSHDGPPPLVATDRRPARASRGEFERGPWDSSPQGVTDRRRRARRGSLRARSQQARRGGPRLGAHGVGTTSAGDHRCLVRTRGRRRGWRRRARPTPRRRRVSARRLAAVDSSPAPACSAASGAGDAAATVAAPPARPAIASITARSAANHRDRPRPVSSAAARHLLDSSVGDGSRGTGSPVNVDINRRSLRPREATTTGPRAVMT